MKKISKKSNKLKMLNKLKQSGANATPELHNCGLTECATCWEMAGWLCVLCACANACAFFASMFVLQVVLLTFTTAYTFMHILYTFLYIVDTIHVYMYIA